MKRVIAGTSSVTRVRGADGDRIIVEAITDSRYLPVYLTASEGAPAPVFTTVALTWAGARKLGQALLKIAAEKPRRKR